MTQFIAATHTEQARLLEIYRWTTAEVEVLIASGDLSKDQQLELLDGVFYRKRTVSPRDSFTSRSLTRRLLHDLGDDYALGIRSAVTLSGYSRPEPDIWIACGANHNYATRLPLADELALEVEVSDCTLATDRETKLLLYAVAGVEEYWIVDVVGQTLERYTEPRADGTYGVTEVLAKSKIRASKADTLTHLLLGAVAVAQLFA